MAVLKRSALTPEMMAEMEERRAETDLVFAAELYRRKRDEALKVDETAVEVIRHEYDDKTAEVYGSNRRAKTWAGKASNALPNRREVCVTRRDVLAGKGLQEYVGMAEYDDLALEEERRLAKDLGIKAGALPAEDAGKWAEELAANSSRFVRTTHPVRKFAKEKTHYLLCVKDLAECKVPVIVSEPEKEKITRRQYINILLSGKYDRVKHALNCKVIA